MTLVAEVAFDWDKHPVYFGYAAVLVAALWLVYRLLISVERLSGKRSSEFSGGTVRPPVQDDPVAQSGPEPGADDEGTGDRARSGE